MKNGFSFNLYETLFKNCFILCSTYRNGNLQLSLFGLDPNVNQIAHFCRHYLRAKLCNVR